MENEPTGLPGDARALDPDALEELRRRAVAAVESGVPQVQVALQLGVSRRAVGQWVRAFREHGEASFPAGRRGRRPGERLTLTDWQQESVLTDLAKGSPDELGLPWLLWTRRSVAELIRREHGITLSTVTVARYLVRWGILGPGGPDALPPGPGDESEVRAAVRAQLAWIQVGLPGHRQGNALVVVTDQEMLHFLLSPRPFDVPGLDDLERRLRMQLSRDVAVSVAACPRRHATVVTEWLDRRRPAPSPDRSLDT